MTIASLASTRAKGITAVLLFVIGAAAWAVTAGWWGHRNASTLPKELAVESLMMAGASNPIKLRQTIRETFRRDDLTGQQRRELRHNIRQAWTTALNKRVDAYFQASPEEQDAILDKQIDDFQQMRNAWEKQRDERQRQLAQKGRPGDGSGRFGFRQRTAEQRKQRSESRNPDQTARRMIYFTALRSRMAERGIQMPRRGPGARGGPGRALRGRGP